MRKRAAKLGSRAIYLAKLCFETIAPTNEKLGDDDGSWASFTAPATDFYTLLRVFAPNERRAGSPCRGRGAVTPSCCMIYSGGWHTEHLAMVLMRLAGRPEWKWVQTASSGDHRTAVRDITVYSDEPPVSYATAGGVLSAMGLEDSPAPVARRPTVSTIDSNKPASTRQLALVNRHTAAQLRGMAAGLGLSKSGTKLDLVRRLIESGALKPNSGKPKPNAGKPSAGKPRGSRRDELRRLTVAELRGKLRRRKAPVSGAKPVLIDRLLAL